MRLKPTTIMKYFKYWPPYLVSGISVKEYDLDRGHVISQMRISSWNANAFGTMYGGSLYSMCDPFYVFILAHKLGDKYYVWDLESNIKFLKATNKMVFASFDINDQEVLEIKQKAETGEKVTPTFKTKIVTSDNELIAEVQKKLYVKQKKEHRLK